jgi:hypothetical protein
MELWMIGWIDGCLDDWLNVWIIVLDGELEGWVDGCTDRQTDRQNICDRQPPPTVNALLTARRLPEQKLQIARTDAHNFATAGTQFVRYACSSN